MVLRPSVPLAHPRGKEEGENPRAVGQIGARSPGRWGGALRSTAPAPQSKPVTHVSRLVALVAPSVASGLGLSILAAGPARDSHYSYRERLCAQPPKAIVRELSDASTGHSSDARPRMLSQLRRSRSTRGESKREPGGPSAIRDTRHLKISTRSASTRDPTARSRRQGAADLRSTPLMTSAIAHKQASPS